MNKKIIRNSILEAILNSLSMTSNKSRETCSHTTTRDPMDEPKDSETIVAELSATLEQIRATCTRQSTPTAMNESCAEKKEEPCLINVHRGYYTPNQIWNTDRRTIFVSDWMMHSNFISTYRCSNDLYDMSITTFKHAVQNVDIRYRRASLLEIVEALICRFPFSMKIPWQRLQRMPRFYSMLNKKAIDLCVEKTAIFLNIEERQMKHPILTNASTNPKPLEKSYHGVPLIIVLLLKILLKFIGLDLFEWGEDAGKTSSNDTDDNFIRDEKLQYQVVEDSYYKSNTGITINGEYNTIPMENCNNTYIGCDFLKEDSRDRSPSKSLTIDLPTSRVITLQYVQMVMIASTLSQDKEEWLGHIPDISDQYLSLVISRTIDASFKSPCIIRADVSVEYTLTESGDRHYTKIRLNRIHNE